MRLNPLSKKYCFIAIKTTESIQYEFTGIDFPLIEKDILDNPISF